MVLETTECIEINNNGRIYTDCMEFSLLRFIQLLGYDDKQLSISEFSNYNDQVNNGLISQFIESHQKIYKEEDYYLDPDLKGVNERNEWASFVSDRDFLDYYRNDNAELFTSVINIIKFFNGFYNMDLDTDINNLADSLNKIAKKFTLDDKKIKMKIKSNITEFKIMSMKEIKKLLSRPDDELKLKSNDENHMISKNNTIISFSINSTNYEWLLYGIYFTDSKLFSNKFVTGHSVIKKLEN